MPTLHPDQWIPRAAAHERRVDAWVEPHLQRRRRGEKHPVEDFLFDYYHQSPARLRRWSPGLGTVLVGAEAVSRYADLADWTVTADGLGATPDPARVTLDPKTTALIVLDYVEDICSRQPSCKGQMLPAMTPFMERVRKAGLVVAYGTREQNMTHWLKEVAPAPNDIKIVNTAQDRFYNTDLDKALKARGIKTLIMVGWKVS